MDVRKIFAVLALCLTGATASADIVTLVDAVETVTTNISVPTGPSGRLMFKPCPGECDEKFVIARLTPETSFSVRGQAVDFSNFRRAFFNLSRSEKHYALVAYNTKTNTVTSVRIGE